LTNLCNVAEKCKLKGELCLAVPWRVLDAWLGNLQHANGVPAKFELESIRYGVDKYDMSLGYGDLVL
jgi:hypothetical protein